MRKLTRSQMTALKLKLMKSPGAKCPLCDKPFHSVESRDVVVDHDHNSGQIRGILCRGCNGAEGKIANAAGRWAGLGMDYEKIVPWLERLVKYLKQQPMDYIYPTHLTEEEKKKAAGDKRKRAAQAKARARQLKIKEQRNA
ncbi:DNA endonuclease [Vibrio phage vB_VpaP_G1]|uniref:DNA endonuclease n=1 Tax=Vibrio phage vB_VpaP_G1 TaxID=2862773 RepID=A0AAE7WU34_9CAUD|nr:endonuclease VII [Vibrio phage vB_VpaP_G1]QYW05837.1 DNA endonuclease [Vibrio phage vB_VpaP_G1]